MTAFVFKGLNDERSLLGNRFEDNLYDTSVFNTQGAFIVESDATKYIRKLLCPTFFRLILLMNFTMRFWHPRCSHVGLWTYK